MRTSWCGPPFQGRGPPAGPDRDFRWPEADGVMNGVGDRRRCRPRRPLADPDAAAEHMVEAALVEVHVDLGRVGDPGDTVVLHPRGENVASAQIGFARLIERVAEALDHRSRGLAPRQRGCCDFSHRYAGMDVEHAHMPEPGIDFDLDHLPRAWN